MIKDKKALYMFIAFAVMIVGLAGSMAYYMANPNAVNEKLTVTTGTMALTFKDNSDGINATLNFDESVTKEFIIENTGTITAAVNLSFNEMVNTYLSESLKYTLSYATSQYGEYTVVKTDNIPKVTSPSKIELASGLVIPAGKSYYYRLVITLSYLDDIDQTQDIDASFKTKFILEQGSSDAITVAQKIKVSAHSGTPTFNVAAQGDEGVFKLNDDQGTSYYFRGAAVDNYVKFGTWAEGTPKSGKDMYWRIVRINGDGSMRLIYDGTEAHENGSPSEDRVILTNIPWNINYSNDAKYVGYKYGGANGVASTSKSQATTNETRSNIQNYLEEWYTTNIVAGGYSTSIADTYFCNDRSTTDAGYGINETTYAPLKRLNDIVVTPSFKCTSNTDKLNVNEGTGGLDYPVGLLTVDEAIAAGGVFTTNKIDNSDATTNTTNVALSCPNMAAQGSTIKCEIIVNTDKVVNGVTGNFNLTNLTYVDLVAKNNFSIYVKSANGFALGNTTGKTGSYTVAEVEFTVNGAASLGLTNLDISDTSFNSYESTNKTASISLIQNNNYYLYKGQSYWTMSPYSMNENASMFYIAQSGNIQNKIVTDSTIGVVPVINLSASVVDTMIGSGTKTNPYRID